MTTAGQDTARATFNNHAQEAKAEVKFMPLVTPFGSLISSIGTQFDHQQIDTAGDAGSLLGSARTNRGAAYFYNEFWLNDTLRTLLAGRIETVRLDGTAGIFPSTLLPPPDNPDLLLQSLGFMPKSISFSVVKDLPSWMVASATVQRIERAPTALELFAHGAHDSPGTFEIGNPGLKIETANTAELGLKRIDGAFRFDAKVYYTKYDNFIFRQATGILCGEDFATCGTGTEFIQTVYAQRDAIFRGGEMAWQWDLLPVATGIFGVDGQYDFVRATFTDGSNVPRMPPMRLGGGTYWRNDNWFVRMGLLHAFGQSDLGQNDTPTAGYNLLKMEISNKQYWRDSPWGAAEITTGLVGDNLLDVDVRNSVQFHKDEILMPGRSIKFFMNAKFGGMVGRTPEWLGKKIEAREIKYAALGALFVPTMVLTMAAVAIVTKAGLASIFNPGVHGFTETLYAYDSQSNNNGSAFAGYGLTNFSRRVRHRRPLPGSLRAHARGARARPARWRRRRSFPASAGTFRTDGATFVVLLVGVIALTAGLMILPALTLGPIVEGLMH